MLFGKNVTSFQCFLSDAVMTRSGPLEKWLSLLLFQLKRDNCGTWDSWGRWELVEEVLHWVKGSPFLRGQSGSTSYKAGSNASDRWLSWETCQAQVKAEGPGGGNVDGLLRDDPAGKHRRRGSQVGRDPSSYGGGCSPRGWVHKQGAEGLAWSRLSSKGKVNLSRSSCLTEGKGCESSSEHEAC